jgi:hypothetical protein
MTSSPDDPEDPTGRKLDEDAAWRDIIEHYGDRPQLEPEEPSSPPERSTEQPAEDAAPPAGREERLRDLFQPTWSDPLDTSSTWQDEGHFVPPDPPPPPLPDPRRRLAWSGLFGSPTVMLVAVVLGISLPDWLLLVLAAGFTGGFVYLVATMSNRRPGDGGDGAVV